VVAVDDEPTSSSQLGSQGVCVFALAAAAAVVVRGDVAV
jgi:hypothetical protein